MARKNSNAGQPNRSAQIARRAERRYTNEQFKAYRKPSSKPVLGPGSENVLDRVYGEIITRETFVVLPEQEKVAA